VPSGLALCKLHHAAFDNHVLGVHTDLTVDLRPDILREPDGPMLKHGSGGQGRAVQTHSALIPSQGFASLGGAVTQSPLRLVDFPH